MHVSIYMYLSPALSLSIYIYPWYKLDILTYISLVQIGYIYIPG